MPPSDYIETKWEVGPGFAFNTGVTLGHKDGHRFAVSFLTSYGVFGVGVYYCRPLSHVSFSLGSLTLLLSWERPYPKRPIRANRRQYAAE